jgi:hypothetical protein
VPKKLANELKEDKKYYKRKEKIYKLEEMNGICIARVVCLFALAL